MDGHQVAGPGEVRFSLMQPLANMIPEVLSLHSLLSAIQERPASPPYLYFFGNNDWDEGEFSMLIGPPPTLLMEVYIDPLMCTACGECVRQCSMGVFDLEDHTARAAHPDTCIGCFKCREFCPGMAIQPRWIMRVS